ncbi:MAG: GNAT family protein [Pyrinomonadaceae bacterium]
MLCHKIDESVEMRLASRKHRDGLFSSVQENLEYLGEWLTWATIDCDEKAIEDFLDRVLKNFYTDEQIPLIIFENDKIIGTISVYNIDQVNKNAEIGYWIAKDSQGKGIVTKCCSAVIDHCFGELDLNRIVIKCATENFKSQAIPERLGFTNEGISRQVAWLRDRFVGMIVYSILKEEWKVNKNPGGKL